MQIDELIIKRQQKPDPAWAILIHFKDELILDYRGARKTFKTESDVQVYMDKYLPRTRTIIVRPNSKQPAEK